MRLSLYAIAASAGLLAAQPCLALTVSSAPNRDVAPHLQQQKGPAGTSLQETMFTSGRPRSGVTFSGERVDQGLSSFGFGSLRTTVLVDPGAPRLGERRETPAPLSLSPPHR